MNTGFQHSCGFFTVAPAGVEPTMGESKSPALPLGDGASVENSIAYFSKFHKSRRALPPKFSILVRQIPILAGGRTDMIYLHCKSFSVQRTAQKGARLMVHHLVIGVIFLVWGIADVLRLQLPGVLARAAGNRPAPRAAASGRGFWVCWSSSWAAGSCCSTFSPTIRPSPASSSR